jgi:hypothetical protein
MAIKRLHSKRWKHQHGCWFTLAFIVVARGTWMSGPICCKIWPWPNIGFIGVGGGICKTCNTIGVGKDIGLLEYVPTWRIWDDNAMLMITLKVLKGGQRGLHWDKGGREVCVKGMWTEVSSWKCNMFSTYKESNLKIK